MSDVLTDAGVLEPERDDAMADVLDVVVPVHDTEPPAVDVRPWSAVVVAQPGDTTLLVADWLVLACSRAGLSVQAMPLGGGPDMPHGMFIEALPAGCPAEMHSDAPWQSVDLLVAGEHLELVRALRAGYAHPDVTTIVASCRREFTQAEQAMSVLSLLTEPEIDALASRSARRYIAFDAPEVAGWYRMPDGIQPSLLLGAICGSGVADIDQDAFREAIATLGIDARSHTRGFRLGLRLGRRNGGRVRRTLTAAQFVRKRRGTLERRERAGFEALIERVENEFAAAHRPVLRAGIHMLTDYHSAAYARLLVDHCVTIARAEDAALAHDTLRVDPSLSVVPVAARHIARMLAYPDLAHVAHTRLRRNRLPELRKRHGISRRTAYEVRDLLAIDAYERAQLAPPALARRIDPTGSPLLCESRRAAVVSTSLKGALRLRRLRSLRKRREASERHLRELEAVELYVRIVREALQVSSELAQQVAESGSLVQGAGAVRAATRVGAMAFWGRVVAQSIAIDRAAGSADFAFTNMVVPHVLRHVGESGPLALWEFAGRVLGIALQHARTGDHDEALAYARALCAA